MEPRKHEFRFTDYPHLEERRRVELKSNMEKWRFRLDVFTNPHLLEKGEAPSYLNPLNPLELKVYDRASMVEMALNLTRRSTFRADQFTDGMDQYRTSLVALLETKGIHCQHVLVSAMGIVFAANMKGAALIERAQELASFSADACAKICDIANVPRIATTVEEVGTAKFNEIRHQSEVKLDQVFVELGNYLTADQKSMVKDWWLWPNAKVMQTMSEAIKKLEGADLGTQSTVMLNIINSCLPNMDISTQNKVMAPTKTFVHNTMDKYISESILAIKSAGKADTASEQQHGRWVSDAVAHTLNLASYGINQTVTGAFTGPKVIQAIGIALVTESVRQLDRLERARQHNKY